MRDHLMDIHNTLIVHDSLRHKEMQEKYAIFKLLNNDAYWQKLKTGTVSDAFAQLTALQNQVYLDEILYLNYIFNQVSGTTLICGPTFKVAIAPNKAALIENEVLKADIYLAQYSAYPVSDIVFVVNNQELPIKDGVAHFETKERTVGTKKIEAEARIRNPLTGQTTNHFGEFEYEVLPKCSRDCK